MSAVRKLDVLISSPGDAALARDAVELALHRWNNHPGGHEDVILRPRRWEEAAVPLSGQGGGPQPIIHEQLVKESDVVIAIFYHRLGTPTRHAASGTVEEIEHAIKKKKRLHIYFSQEPAPANVDGSQFQALQVYKDKMHHDGLIAEFASIETLTSYVLEAIFDDIKILKKKHAKAEAKRAAKTKAKAAERKAEAARLDRKHRVAAKRLLAVADREPERRLFRPEGTFEVEPQGRGSIRIRNVGPNRVTRIRASIENDRSRAHKDGVPWVQHFRGPDGLESSETGVYSVNTSVHPAAHRTGVLATIAARLDQRSDNQIRFGLRDSLDVELSWRELDSPRRARFRIGRSR